MSTTLLLDPDTWSLKVDNAGNIATVDGGYALAQDAACAIRLFLAELYYDNTQGIPYWEDILGQMPPTTLMKDWFVRAAMTVPGVVSAKAFISSWVGREVQGQVQVYDKDGNLFVANF